MTNALKAIFADAFARTLPRQAGTFTSMSIGKSKTRRVSSKGMRFYEVLRTNHGARRGSKRATQLEIVLAHTDTLSAKRAGAEGIDINFAEAQGLIRFTS